MRRGAPRKRETCESSPYVECWTETAKAKAALTPRTPKANAKCPGTAVPKRACEARMARETPSIWRRSTQHPLERHCVLQISVLGASAGLCPVLRGRPLPGLVPPGEAAGGLPRALRPLSPTRRRRSGSWLAPGNWPALSPQNSAGILGAWKWVNKV